MTKTLRTLALAIAFAATPACASLEIPSPFAAARSVDQHAYALLQTYASLVEEAADIVRNPATPTEARRAIGQAERTATPTIETLAAALDAYNTARNAGDAEAARVRLDQARAEAEAPVAALASLIDTAQH